MPFSKHPAAQVHFSRRMLSILAILFLSPWAVIIWMQFSGNVSAPVESFASAKSLPAEPVEVASPTTAPSSSVTQTGSVATPATQPNQYITVCNPGPWGTVEKVPIVLELPQEYVFVPAENREPIKWTFSDKSRSQAIDFLISAGLELSQIQTLRAAKWTDIPGGSTVEPGDPLILSLKPEVRAKVYHQLIKYKENARVIDPYWYRPGWVDVRLRGSELQESTINLLKSVLYVGGPDQLLFSDVEPVTRAIKDPNERLRFMKAVSRKRTMIGRLHITKDTDVNALAEYWGSDGRQKDIVPLLNSLKYNTIYGVEPESKLNIVCLLPPFARERLYNHPYNREPSAGMKEDCFWTAFNFFCDEPDYKFNDLNYAGQILQKDYYKLIQPNRLGDLILLADKNGNAIHAASYICDDIVFTKNGENYTQPWILMRMQDMLDTYRIQSPDVQAMYYRRK